MPSDVPVRLSILIPVYNEQAYLNRIIQRVLAVEVPGIDEKELITVNDASTDRTAEILDALQTEHPEIRVFHQPHNMGKGAAIRRAIQEMSGQIAIIQDADLEYDPNEYSIVLRPILEGHADVVYGSRFAVREMRRVVYYHHKLGNLLLTHLSNWMTGLDLTDMETCYKAFRSELLKTIPIRSNRFGIEPEITAKVAKRGAVVYEVPISYYGRQYSEGKKIGWKDGFSAIWTILKYWLIDDCYTEQCDRQALESMNHVRQYTRWIADIGSKWYGSKILDIGSGTGNIAKFLPQKERLVLSDIDPNMLKILRNSYDGNRIVDVRRFDPDSDDDVRNLAFDYHFDTITMFNILERIEHDDEFLLRLKSLFEPNGKLIFIVPQYTSLYGSLDRVAGNFRRYTKKEIRSLLKKAGYDVLQCSSFNSVGLPGWFLNSVLLKRKKMGKFQLKFYNTLIPLCAFMERWGSFLPGMNLLVVAQPSKTEKVELE